MYLLYAGFNCTGTSSITGCMGHLIHNRSFASQVWAWFAEHGHGLWEWIKQPYVLIVIFAWSITFTIIVTIILGMGFGPRGVVAGTAAALFQSVFYGAFTPAAGIFATLTSVAMTGGMFWPAAVFAAVLAIIVAAVVWAAGAGR